MRIITLFGKLLNSQHPGRTVMDVDPALGNAPEFRLAGQITILDRQISDCVQTSGRDVLRIPEHIASDLANKSRQKGL